MHRMSLNHRGASAMLRPTGWKKGDDLKQNLVPSASLWSTRGLFYLETLSGFLFCRMPNFLPNLCPEISGILETTPEKSRELRRNHVQWSRLEKNMYMYIRRPRPTARGSASGKRGCGQQEIQQRVGDQQQQQKPLQQQEENVAKIHSSSKRKKQPKSSVSMRFR